MESFDYIFRHDRMVLTVKTNSKINTQSAAQTLQLEKSMQNISISVWVGVYLKTLIVKQCFLFFSITPCKTEKLLRNKGLLGEEVLGTETLLH